MSPTQELAPGLAHNHESEPSARSITQVFMSPAVKRAIADGHSELLLEKRVPCGIVVYFKNAEQE